MMTRNQFFGWLHDLHMSQRPMISEDVAIIKLHSKYADAIRQ